MPSANDMNWSILLDNITIVKNVHLELNQAINITTITYSFNILVGMIYNAISS